MFDTPRSFIDALGGYRAVARRLRMGSSTLHGYVTVGALPPRWYSALLALAAEVGIEPPPRSLFSFEPLPALVLPNEDAA